MAKAKPAQSLLNEIATLAPTVDQRARTWWDRLSEKDPDTAQAIRDVAVDWVNHGQTRTTFPHVTQLHRYLAGRDVDRPRPSVLGGVHYESFSRFVRGIREEQHRG